MADFTRMTYTQAIEELKSAKKKFEYPVEWCVDLQTEHERYLTEEVYKKPVIVSNLKSFHEIVDDQKTAIFFNSEDSSSLSKAVNDLINNDNLMSEIKKNAYKLMLEKYNWTQLGKLTSDAYNLSLIHI